MQESSALNSRVTLLNSWAGYSIAFIRILGAPKGKTPVRVFLFCIGDTHRYKSGIIFKTFQGELRVETQQVLVRADSGENVKPHFDIDRGNINTKKKSLYFLTFKPELKTYTSPYLFLALDLPPPPLFQDAVEKNIIPQVSLHSVLAKYDGKTSQVHWIL